MRPSGCSDGRNNETANAGLIRPGEGFGQVIGEISHIKMAVAID
jgi:hypothetical protein